MDLLWSLSDSNRGNLNKVLELLVSEFGEGQETGKAQKNFLRASLAANETVVDFFWRLSDLLKTAFPTLDDGVQDQTLKDAFIRGLPYAYQDRLAPGNYAGSRDVLRAAKNMAEFRQEAIAQQTFVSSPTQVYHTAARPRAPPEEVPLKMEQIIEEKIATSMGALETRLTNRMEGELKGFGATLQATTQALQQLSAGLGGAAADRPRSFAGNCFNCGKAGHRVFDCRFPRDEATIATNQGRGRNQYRPAIPSSQGAYVRPGFGMQRPAPRNYQRPVATNLTTIPENYSGGSMMPGRPL